MAVRARSSGLVECHAFRVRLQRLVLRSARSFREEHSDERLLVHADLVTELLYHSPELQYFLNLFPVQRPRLSQLLARARANARLLLHVGFRSRGEARLQLTSLVYVQSKGLLRSDCSEHLVHSVLGELDVERSQINLHFLELLHDGAEPAVIDAADRFYHSQVVV